MTSMRSMERQGRDLIRRGGGKREDYNERSFGRVNIWRKGWQERFD